MLFSRLGDVDGGRGAGGELGVEGEIDEDDDVWVDMGVVEGDNSDWGEDAAEVEAAIVSVRNVGTSSLDDEEAGGTDLSMAKGLGGMKALSFEGRESCQFDPTNLSDVEGSEGEFACNGASDGNGGCIGGGGGIGIDGKDDEADGVEESN